MKYCPRKGCNRAGPDINRCNNFALSCTEPRDVVPSRQAVIYCKQCDLTRAVPVGDIVRGRVRLVRTCPTSECQALLLPPKKEAPANASKKGA